MGIQSKIILAKERYPELNGTERSLVQNSFGAGPFIRYYFLPEDKRINLFSEASFFYRTLKNKSVSPPNNKSISYDYSILGGMVVFFNSSVGIEFTLGYNNDKQKGIDFKNEDLRFGIGFQIHLEREK